MSDLLKKDSLEIAVRKALDEIKASESTFQLVNQQANLSVASETSVDSNAEIKLIRGKEVRCTRFPFEIGLAGRGVFSKDILSIEESPMLGAGFMEIFGVSFPWTLKYDEVEYVVEGVLNITTKDQKITATEGDVVFIPKNTEIEFSSPSRARFLYVTYPADWQNQ